MSAWVPWTVHDRPATRVGWLPFARYGGAFGGLAVIAYFIFQIVVAKHLDRNFKYGAIAVIAAIGIAGAIAILQNDPSDDVPSGERLYTAAEVAELLNAVRAAGAAHVDASALAPPTCTLCGRPNAEVRALDGTRYHRRCFQSAYREREAARGRR